MTDEERYQRLSDKEEEYDKAIKADYSKREAGSASSVIPAAIKVSAYEIGAVSPTDSESEVEFQKQIRGDRVLKPFKWTEKHELELEELLIKHMFDFKAALRDFLRLINHQDSHNFYQLDMKTLQLRWTDIEIRKYRLNNSAASNVNFFSDGDSDLEMSKQSSL